MICGLHQNDSYWWNNYQLLALWIVIPLSDMVEETLLTDQAPLVAAAVGEGDGS